MVKEQERFDILSTNLSNITDLASPRYMKLSAEMVKSQQMLALLVARNMHCFKVVRIADEFIGLWISWHLPVL